MPTLLVSDWLPNGSRQLAAAARRDGWDVVCRAGKEPPLDLEKDDLAYYGGTDVAHQVTRRLGVALLEPPLDWLAKLPRKYALREVRYATVAAARRLAAAAFIKPADATNKCFDSGVYPGGWAVPERRGFDDSTPVLIAESVTWEVEYRCILLEDRVMTCASYPRAGRWVRARDHRWHTPEPELAEVTHLCRALVGDGAVRLPPPVTLDVGRIEGRGWASVELNPVWSSGRYGCDPARALPALRRACVRRENLAAEDQLWVIDRRPTT